MKYFCLAEKDQEASIFLFPREFDNKGIEENITHGLRNQTYDNWRRFQFEVKSCGDFTFISGDLSRPEITLHDFSEDEKIVDICKRSHDLIMKQFQENMKYICVSGEGDKEYIYVFPKFVHHDAMEEVISHMSYAMDSCRYKELLSAGFVNSNLECFGESETLGIPSRMDTDTKILHKQLRVR